MNDNRPPHTQVWIHPGGTWSSMRRDGSFSFVSMQSLLSQVQGNASQFAATVAAKEAEIERLKAENMELQQANIQLFHDSERYWALLDDPEIKAKDDLLKAIESQANADQLARMPEGERGCQPLT